MTKIKKIDVTLETALLKNMADKGLYEQYNQYIDIARLLPNTKILLHDYARYYVLYPEHRSIDFDLFYTQFTQSWHGEDLDQNDIEYYRDYVFPAVRTYSGMDIDKCLYGLMEKQCVEDISAANKKYLDVGKLRGILDVFETKISAVTNLIDTDINTIDNINFGELDKAEGIPWFLPTLQQNLMSITMGQFIIVSADFGTGKSAFVVSQATHTLKYLTKNKDKRSIMYFNSEGTAADVMCRMLSCLYRDKVVGGFEEIVDRHIEIIEKYKLMFDSTQFIIIQMSDVGTFLDMKLKVQKYKPALIIIDICDKLAPDEDPINLKKLYDSLRVLAGSECPIIGTSQSGDTSFFDQEEKKVKQKKWLDSHSLYGSKTGKGGSADTIITIGREGEHSPLRYISTPKKKRGKECKITCELIDKYSYYKQLDY